MRLSVEWSAANFAYTFRTVFWPAGTGREQGMRIRALSIALALTLLANWPSVVTATITVNPAQPIMRQVLVQIIQTALDDGSSPATVFGNATQTTSVEAGIDKIWAQSGIDINFLPTINHYNNTFAYQGTAGSGTRSQNDLGTILANARNQGSILNPSSTVIDMFFVNVTPGFTPLSENTTAGLANIARNGIAVFVGDSLLTFQNGLDIVAGVVAHEIGHNLGLNHTADGSANLMAGSNSQSQQLTTDQISTVLSATSFPQPFSPQLTADYNHNGIVDAADYTVWRNTLGTTANLAADGNGSGAIDSGDYTIWKSNFGRTGSGGAGSGAAVPEPVTIASCIWIAVVLLHAGLCRRRRHRMHEMLNIGAG